MSKVMNVPNYRHATRKALNEIVTRKGGHVNWSTYVKDFKISKNYGTVLNRLGIVQRVKGGFYKSNAPGYISNKKAQEIVDVIRRYNLINQPSNTAALRSAKSQLQEMGVIPVSKQPKGKIAPVTISKAPKAMKIVALINVPTDVLLAEISRRTK